MSKTNSPVPLVNISELLAAYERLKPNVDNIAERVQFGTSGHRGSSLTHSFNQNHILAIVQAICDYRLRHAINGPLFLGFDTHALSLPAFQTSLEVLAANGVEVMIAQNDEFTPTPVISHAILTYNKGRRENFADGIVITPSHNPPSDGGIKYNPPHGGPAEKEITDSIQNEANAYLKNKLSGIKRTSFALAKSVPTTHAYDFITPYVLDLDQVVDMKLIRDSQVKLAVDPLGGSAIHYWHAIADYYDLNLTVLNQSIDPSFDFMARDWDGKIRMDPSSAFVMAPVVAQSKGYDVAFACDTDADRHGIVTPHGGLIPSNHYLATSIYYLFQNRPLWKSNLKVGKTVVSSDMIRRVAKLVGREVYEVPVGFKWFVDGVFRAELGFVGEESAGATFLRKDGTPWTTDKDGLIPCFLAAEMTAKMEQDPAAIYEKLTARLGNPAYRRVEAKADPKAREKFKTISKNNVKAETLGGEKIKTILTEAPGNGASIGGIKVETESAWFAVRPSGTEDIFKIYAESFRGEAHLEQVLKDAQKISDDL
jgi:phosphoglucomutase